jgi:menaquinol-cytochrome c reductase iron-sulfur subunit
MSSAKVILTNGYSKIREYMTNHTPTPRSQDPEDIQKRNFLKGLTAAVLGFLSLALTWPLVSFLIPSNESGGEKFIKVPNFPGIPVGKPTKLNFESVDVQAFITSNIVYDIWVIKHAADKVTVYSPLCPHLNCRYNFDSSKDQFACPCHGSVFNEDGKCIAGPAPRPLDTLPYKIEAGELYVQWELYKAAIPEKVKV